LSLEFILAGLAGEDDHEGEAGVGLDAIEHGLSHLALVGAQLDAGTQVGEVFQAVEEFGGYVGYERHR
jgi:hypothetical protein